jgi:hypothetical protein
MRLFSENKSSIPSLTIFIFYKEPNGLSHFHKIIFIVVTNKEFEHEEWRFAVENNNKTNYNREC